MSLYQQQTINYLLKTPWDCVKIFLAHWGKKVFKFFCLAKGCVENNAIFAKYLSFLPCD
jgi:hypothetical protein